MQVNALSPVRFGMAIAKLGPFTGGDPRREESANVRDFQEVITRIAGKPEVNGSAGHIVAKTDKAASFAFIATGNKTDIALVNRLNELAAKLNQPAPRTFGQKLGAALSFRSYRMGIVRSQYQLAQSTALRQAKSSSDANKYNAMPGDRVREILKLG